ncbi:MAG: pilus assembly protein TadG-related protein [Flavobacteriaceae bacterium]
MSGANKTGLFTRFASDTRGNVAIIFGIALLPLIAMAGAALDFSSAYNARAKLQVAADAAALAATRNYGKSWAQRKQIATDAFNQNLQALRSLDNVQFNIVDEGNSHVVTASATEPTSLLGIVGIKHVPVAVDAVAMTPVASLEVVMVLDNTGSMSSSSKISILRESAENFVDMMETAAAIPGKTIKIGLVPFTTMVRVDPDTYREADWLLFEDDGSNGRGNGRGRGRGRGNSGSGESAANWKGCIYDRQEPYDVDDTPPDTDKEKTLFEPDPDNGFSSSSCRMAMVHELSNNFSSLRDNIDDMRAEGNTNIPLGVIWGLHLLSSSEPFTQGDPWSEVETTKVMIVLTDGENTESRHGNSTAAIDQRLRKACTEVKDHDVLVYTVRVVNGDADLLRSCATDASMFTDIRNASELTPTFEKLAADIINRHLRLTM